MANILECRALTKSYTSNMPVLSNFNLEIPEGKIIGLLGPNGSGKTTLIKLASGLLTPTNGEILVGGYPVGEYTKSIVSYLPERPYFNSWMKTENMLDFFCDFYADFDRKRAEAILSDLGIDIKRPMKELSKGTKEKVQLALVMSRNAKLYLLDEPIAGVDPAARDYILRTIINNYNKEASVIISTHLISDIEGILDEFLFICNGQIIMQGEADATRKQYGKSLDALFREVFKC